jgi:DNA-binding MarR family transcriptional regulator
LLDDGRVERDTHDNDRRRSVLRLSADGYRIYDQVAPLTLEFERNLLGDMAEAERTLLFRLLDRLDELELRAEADVPAP